MALQWLPSLSRPTPPAGSYTDVLIPLEEAHLYSHKARKRAKRDEYERLNQHDDDDAIGPDLDSRPGAKDDQDSDSTSDETAAVIGGADREYTIESLRREVRSGAKGQWTDYELKSKLINKAIQDIGMGSYNWQLFVLCGFGWFADNLWLQGVSLTLPSLSAEFGISEKTVRYTTSFLFVGLCFGSFLWGIGSDVMGRRIAFNCTLLITSVFGLLSGYASSWPVVCLLFALLGFGVGGNLPVDGALFLEFLPDASSALLTLLSVWWPVGQLFSSLWAWYFIANWPADVGWRKFVFTIGVVTLVMFCVRFFAFRLLESPKFLLSKGRQSEAVAVVHGIAYRNNSKTWLTEEILDAVAEDIQVMPSLSRRQSTTDLIRDRLSSFSADRLRPLFRTRTLGFATGLIWFCWATIGMGYPLFNAFLPQYLSHGGKPSGSSSSSTSSPQSNAADSLPAEAISAETYRNYAITSIVGVPGSLLAAYLVDHPSPFFGRRGTLSISTLVSAVFLFLFAQFGNSAGSQLLFSCVEAFSQNIMYGVLYAFTPEIFPAPVRGSATGVASFLNRFAGLLAPILAATVPGDGTTTPIYLAGSLILAAFLGMCLIPIETRGKQRL